MISPLPVGGSTGLCHESSFVIDEAATWLAKQTQSTRVPDLRVRFGLSVNDALVARSEASTLSKAV